jgi:hypothetical protein
VQERQNYKQRKNLLKQYSERSKLYFMAEKLTDFNHANRDVKVFRQELSLLLSHIKLSTDKQTKRDCLNKLTYVVELLHKNKVTPDAAVEGQLFEYAVFCKNLS